MSKYVVLLGMITEIIAMSGTSNNNLIFAGMGMIVVGVCAGFITDTARRKFSVKR